MTVLGLIVEFNPFHHGHGHLIASAQKKYDFDAVVGVMSGNFLQRGEPALCDKWSRTKMALNGGVDLVIELPFSYAARSAYFFARGAVQLLAATKIVTHLGFGSEAGNLEYLTPVAELLAHESPQFKALLKANLASGQSFAAARAQALQQLIPEAGLDDLLSSPNNILAIEYLRIIKEFDYPLLPITIPRQGVFHSTDLTQYASSTAIREALHNNRPLTDLASSMPAASWAILKHELENGKVVTSSQALEQLILFQLKTLPVEQLARIYDINEGLENRVKKACAQATTLDELRGAIKSKRYSLTHINRIFLYTLFNLTKNQIESIDGNEPPYLNILGFSTRGEKILQQIKNKSTLLILNRGKDVKAAYDGKYGDLVKNMVGLDVLATDIYSLIYPETKHRLGRRDFMTSPIRETT